MNKSEQLIACLEGEIAKRDEELAACRVAVENCEVFRARIAEMQERFDSSAHRTSLIGRLEIENAQLSAELAAIKAQEPVAYISGCYRDVIDGKSDRTPLGAELAFVNMGWIGQIPLYAAPVSEAKAQGVVMPERANASHGSHDHQSGWNACLDEVARLNAATAAPAADAWLVEALENVLKSGRGSSGRIILDEEDEADARAALAAHRANGVV